MVEGTGRLIPGRARESLRAIRGVIANPLGALGAAVRLDEYMILVAGIVRFAEYAAFSRTPTRH